VYLRLSAAKFVLDLIAALGLVALAPLAYAADAGHALPRPRHIVIVIEENKGYRQIIGNPDAPYINALAKGGALFTQSHAVARPSQPNYLALFSGSTHGVTHNGCLRTLSGENLASELLRKGYGFAIYSESLPEAGFTGCSAGDYRRKHNPVVNWQGVNVPAAANLPFTAFPSDFAQLPTVAMVVPNQENDMHNGEPSAAIAAGDRWLRQNLDPYVRWAQSHDSLLILTWDEDDWTSANHIPTLFVGAAVRPGIYTQRIDHYNILRTISEMYGLRLLGNAAQAAVIDGIWRGTAPER